ncbi:MAG TPA: protein-disulfide reductase DsbD domain-containing protein, partial [Roseiarcus sp.]
MSAESLVKRFSAAAGGLPIAGALAVGLPLVLAAMPAFAADAFSTDWAPAAKSQARLIAGRGDLAGFEIALAPGAITYWRDPGDAGLPPTLDFSMSDNVASVEPEFPAPKRIKEADGGEAFGYDGGVVFPLRVKPRDPTKPATLKLNADFAVCEKVCLPAKAHLELKLP